MCIRDRLQQQREDEKFRNAIEGKFGQAKRRFSLGQIMAKLSDTAETSIAIIFLVMNLQLRLKRFFVLFFRLFPPLIVRPKTNLRLIQTKFNFSLLGLSLVRLFQ